MHRLWVWHLKGNSAECSGCFDTITRLPHILTTMSNGWCYLAFRLPTGTAVQGSTATEVVALAGGRRFAKLGTFAWLAVAVSCILQRSFSKFTAFYARSFTCSLVPIIDRLEPTLL